MVLVLAAFAVPSYVALNPLSVTVAVAFATCRTPDALPTYCSVYPLPVTVAVTA